MRRRLSRACLICGKKPLPAGRRKYCSSVCSHRWQNRRFHFQGRQGRELRIAWAAGFFDGEGSVSISQLRSGGYNLRISASQRKREPLDELAELFGGSIYCTPPRGKRAESHSWELSGDRAGNTLVQMRPYLKVKTQQAMIAEQWLASGFTHRTRRSEDQLAFREQLVSEMRHLNLRGPIE